MILVVGGIVGRADAHRPGRGTAAGPRCDRAPHRAFLVVRASYFEEWDDPLISGIRWVEELTRLPAAHRLSRAQQCRVAKDRIVDPAEVARRDPEVIVASWCGKAVKPRLIRAAGWEAISAVRNGHVYEIKSAYILQPGPASLTEGVRRFARLHRRRCAVEANPGPGPGGYISRVQNRVVARYLDGRTLKGQTADFLPTKPSST